MFKPVIFIAFAGLLSACNSTEPAGGRGPFDPPPPVRVDAPLFSSTELGVQLPPSNRPQPQAENQELAQDVTAALQNTQPTNQQIQQPRSVLAASADRDIGIDPNDTSIDLNASSQETQKRQRDIAARIRAENAAKLRIIQPEGVSSRNAASNVIKFARETTHPKGTKVYNRPTFRSRTQSASVCRKFSSVEEAQRQFLSNGGPTTDRYNLDPDGDGFACKFDPEHYRKIKF